VVLEGVQQELIADIDRIMACKQMGKEVSAEDVSHHYVKLDIQGPLSFKLIKEFYGEHVLKNRSNPDKNMNYFSFNEFERLGQHYLISPHWLYQSLGLGTIHPLAVAEADCKALITRPWNSGSAGWLGR
jgi:glycine cleavage system aminomethyltransferase T